MRYLSFHTENRKRYCSTALWKHPEVGRDKGIRKLNAAGLYERDKGEKAAVVLIAAGN